MSTYRAAVIGLGRMGSTFDDEMTRGGSVFLPYCHGPAYIHSPKTELVAGADIHDEQRAIFGERWGLTDDQLYSDFEEMLEKAKPDIVSVCTTARIRSEIVHKVARAGVKAIWAEKPLAFSLEEGDEMVRVCREEGVSLAVNCARRWNPMYSQARNIIAAGHIGNVLQVTAHAACQLSSNGSHLLDTVRFLAGGDVQWVLGEMESDEAAGTDGDIMGNGYLVFDNGVRAFVRSMKASGAGWDFDVIGEKGRVRTPNDANAWELTSMTGEEFPPVENRRPGVRARNYPVMHQFPWPTHIQGMGLTIVDDIISSIENGHPPKCSGEDALKALETAIAMRESHRRGFVRVDLPLEDRSLRMVSSETAGDEVPARIRRARAAASA